MFTIAEIAAATNGRVIGPATGGVDGVSTDSRTVAPGQLFVPLRGEHFDGHTFLADAAARGVTVLLAEEQWLKSHVIPEAVTCIAVKNTLRALGDLAASWRLRFEIPVIGVTGSNGKTTVKEMLATILEQSGAGLKTSGNLNNLIGLPRMMFQLRPEHRWAVLEMGMSEPGEIDRLAEITRPQVGVVLNALPAHLQSMGTVEAVAAAKGELLNRISDNGLAVVNADDPRVASLHQNPSARRISFGINRGEVRAKDIEILGLAGQRFLLVTPKGETTIHLKACGRHNIYNALAAAAALLDKVELGVIAAGLEAFTPYKGRFQAEQLDGITIIDDSYNSNPASVKAALETLSQVAAAGHRIAVLGDMLELGEYEIEAHLTVGALAASNADRLYLLGELMTKHAAESARLAGMPAEAVSCCTDHEQIAHELYGSLRENDVILVKGSRGMTMERVATELKKLMQHGKEE
ncbi:MAG: UDP-N-acetylmuramoylalanyl-D-glutamyl-2, 6-diaminopimelate--D-alanyl-D-alanine ligase [Geobacteraceae bacterium GWC2_55_20]|nr:MAG: UDP-N-acetylmuramoylalanyl-D-glutamyl-2, 6-diaminopimelate--D-alanyl-D-alanine ligase [Geobacteraceae bacterium GWC2_55_20]OGU26374.1 MAG: UDP-N-acetylmuramoylalanyl-D-glutamyl-2, 6-diaminopimelate--D-alanyl-D-alanine ligase [Geobacteraceae bacterium GWF2_54_21]HCE69541.1 UDP-N-acetylmuramoyl-tripeptide--D-alanyl-D-alanine ligase [Geobacter sp.]